MSAPLAERLRRAWPELSVSDAPPDRIGYARDLWPRHHLAVRAGRVGERRPAAVAWPETPDQAASLVRWCADEGVPIVPYGAGSGVCGAVLPTPDMLVIDVKRMHAVRRIDREQSLIEVEAGALGIRLEEDLQRQGLTVGHFPSSILCSTVGGWVAARGAGQMSGLYGKIEDMVAALECIDGRGERVTLHRRVHGAHLTPLIVGSEGVLSLITSATLRLHAAPTRRSFGALSFPSMRAGYEAIREMVQRGLRPAVCRLYDPFDSMMARRGAAKADMPDDGGKSGDGGPLVGAGQAVVRGLLRMPGALNAAIEGLGTRVFGGSMMVLVFETEDHEEQLAAALNLATSRGAEDLGPGPARHWMEHRYGVSYRQAPMFMAGAFVDTMEVAAPWSSFDALYDGIREALGEHVLVMAHMSHAYPDGCSIYFTFAGAAPSDAECEARYDAAWRAASAAAIAAGGTLSHHHGVGRSKAPRMGDELGLGIELVEQLRHAFDPAGIFNPGNLMPATRPPRVPLPQAPADPLLDERSQTVHAAGTHTLGQVEAVLRTRDLSLAVGGEADRAMTLDAWLGAGAPGRPDPWLDPLEQLVTGFVAELPAGGALEVRPCPRRAVGPDLYALFHGTEGRAGRVHTVHLRAPRGPRPALPCGLERDPATGDDEQRWIDRAVGAAAAVS